MSGLEAVVEQTVQDPLEIRLSTLQNTAVAFVSDPNIGTHAEGIRILETYGDTYYEKGASSGMITTAYPVDIVKYSNPQLGAVIYKRRGRK
jgi:hypothetical protein